MTPEKSIPIERLLYISLYKVTNVTAAAITYGWSEGYARKELTEILSNIANTLKPRWEEIKNLPRETLLNIGFMSWDGKTLLIPLWLLKALPDGEVVTCINDKSYTVGVDDIDDDTRYGCIPYGIFKPDEREGAENESI